MGRKLVRVSDERSQQFSLVFDYMPMGRVGAQDFLPIIILGCDRLFNYCIRKWFDLQDQVTSLLPKRSKPE
jgi:hypothetical protein